jgi:hypothetical protein
MKFLVNTIRHLRQQEEVLLFGNLFEIDEPDKQATVAFLREEYQTEALDYPFQAPEFDAEAALWAAQTVYTTAQILLYRQHNVADLPALLPDCLLDPTPSRILSADLTLRFLPDMLSQAQYLDPEDAVIPLLGNKLIQWHYSGITAKLPLEKLDFRYITADNCLHQLYTNRIIQYKKISLASHPAFVSQVLASLGDHIDAFWSELSLLRSQPSATAS